MTDTHTTDKQHKTGWLQGFKRWLAHPTHELLPPIFGDAEPPELKVFEAEVEEARHDIQEVPAPPSVHAGRSKPARRK